MQKFHDKEGKILKKEYNIVGKFDSNGKRLYVVRVNGNAHVMEEKEIKKMYGSWHPERWKK